MTTVEMPQIRWDFLNTNQPDAPTRFAIHYELANWDAQSVEASVTKEQYESYFADTAFVMDAVHYYITAAAAGVHVTTCRQYCGRTGTLDWHNFGQGFVTQTEKESGTLYGPCVIRCPATSLTSSPPQLLKMYFEAGTYAATDDIYLTLVGRLYKRLDTFEITKAATVPEPQRVTVEGYKWPLTRRY